MSTLLLMTQHRLELRSASYVNTIIDDTTQAGVAECILCQHYYWWHNKGRSSGVHLMSTLSLMTQYRLERRSASYVNTIIDDTTQAGVAECTLCLHYYFWHNTGKSGGVHLIISDTTQAGVAECILCQHYYWRHNTGRSGGVHLMSTLLLLTRKRPWSFC